MNEIAVNWVFWAVVLAGFASLAYQAFFEKNGGMRWRK